MCADMAFKVARPMRPAFKQGVGIKLVATITSCPKLTLFFALLTVLPFLNKKPKRKQIGGKKQPSVKFDGNQDSNVIDKTHHLTSLL